MRESSTRESQILQHNEQLKSSGTTVCTIIKDYCVLLKQSHAACQTAWISRSTVAGSDSMRLDLSYVFHRAKLIEWAFFCCERDSGQPPCLAQSWALQAFQLIRLPDNLEGLSQTKALKIVRIHFDKKVRPSKLPSTTIPKMAVCKRTSISV